MHPAIAAQLEKTLQDLRKEYTDRAHGRRNYPGRQSASAKASPEGQRNKLPQVQGITIVREAQ